MVLDILSEYKAKATFFCIGQNIQMYQEIFERVINDGHTVGNHTFHHLNGWRSSKEDYLTNANQCHEIIETKFTGPAYGSLFRPPYGKLTPAGYSAIKKRYKIVMWDVLTRDWEINRSPESCFSRIKRKAGPGSIVVFHDSIKAKARMLPALEMTLKHFSGLGYKFESLEKYI